MLYTFPYALELLMALPVIYSNTTIPEKFAVAAEVQKLMTQFWQFKQKTVHEFAEGQLIILPEKQIGLFFGNATYTDAISFGLGVRSEDLQAMGELLALRLSVTEATYSPSNFVTTGNFTSAFKLSLLTRKDDLQLFSKYNYDYRNDAYYIGSGSKIIKVNPTDAGLVNNRYTDLVYVNITTSVETNGLYRFPIQLLQLVNTGVSLLTPLRVALDLHINTPTDKLYSLNSFYLSKWHRPTFLIAAMVQLTEALILNRSTAGSPYFATANRLANRLAFHLPTTDSNYGEEPIDSFTYVSFAQQAVEDSIIQGNSIHTRAGISSVYYQGVDNLNDANFYEKYDAITYDLVGLLTVFLSIIDEEFNPLVHFAFELLTDVNVDSGGLPSEVYIESPITKELVLGNYKETTNFGVPIVEISLTDDSYYTFTAQVYEFITDADSGTVMLSIAMGYYIYSSRAVYVPGIQAYKTPWLFLSNNDLQYTDISVEIEYDEVENIYYRSFRTNPLSGSQVINGSYKLTDKGAVPWTRRTLPINSIGSINGQAGDYFDTYKNVFMHKAYDTLVNTSNDAGAANYYRVSSSTTLPTYTVVDSGLVQPIAPIKAKIFLDIDGASIYDKVIYPDTLDNVAQILINIQLAAQAKANNTPLPTSFAPTAQTYSYITSNYDGDLATDFSILVDTPPNGETIYSYSRKGYEGLTQADIELQAEYASNGGAYITSPTVTRAIIPLVQKSPPIFNPNSIEFINTEIRLIDNEYNILGVFAFMDSIVLRDYLYSYITALYQLLRQTVPDARYRIYAIEEARRIVTEEDIQEPFIPELDAEGNYKYAISASNIALLAQVRLYKDLIDTYLTTNVSYNSFMSVEFLANYLMASDPSYVRIKNIMMDNSVHKLPIMVWPVPE